MVRLPRVVQQLDRREDVDVVYMISDLKKIVNGDTRCLFILQSTRSVSGHISHHDRCRVGSVRLSDSAPISA